MSDYNMENDARRCAQTALQLEDKPRMLYSYSCIYWLMLSNSLAPNNLEIRLFFPLQSEISRASTAAVHFSDLASLAFFNMIVVCYLEWCLFL